MIYDNIIANKAGSHANNKTLTTNNETLGADISGTGLTVLNTKVLSHADIISGLLKI